MTDIVERLRQGIDPLDIPEGEQAMDRAADEIERLRECIFRSNEKYVEADDHVVDAMDKIEQLKIELDRATRARVLAPQVRAIA